MRLHLLLFFLASTHVAQSQLHRAERVFERNNKAVVRIFNFDSGKNPVAQGSGVILKKQRWLVTNLHMIYGGETFISYAKAGDSFLDLGRVLFADADMDIAILEIDKTVETDIILNHIPELKLVPLENLKIGQRLYAIGSPAGMANTISDGILSGLRHTSGKTPVLQITAPISPGSSGGGVFDARGRLMGIVTSMYEGEGIQNINFAVPASIAIDTELNVDSIVEARNELHGPDQFFLNGIEEFDKRFYARALMQFLHCEKPGVGNEHILFEYIGRCQLRLTNPQEALSAFETGIEIMPFYAPCWVGKSKALLKMGLLKESIEAEAKALSLDPNILKIWEEAEKND